MCRPFLGAVDKLEQHGVCDFQPSELVERAWWHDNLSTMVDVLPFWTRQHSYGIAAIVFIEAATGSHGSSSHDGRWIHTPAHHCVFIVKAAAELDHKSERSTSKRIWDHHDDCRMDVGTEW